MKSLKRLLKIPFSVIHDPLAPFKPSWSDMGFKSKFLHITPEIGFKAWYSLDAFGQPLENVFLRDRSLFFNQHLNKHGFGLKVYEVVDDPPGFFIERAEVALDRAVSLWGVEREHYLVSRFGRNEDSYAVLCDADFSTNRASKEINALIEKLGHIGVGLNLQSDVSLTNFGYSNTGEFVIFDFDLCYYHSEYYTIPPYDPQLNDVKR